METGREGWERFYDILDKGEAMPEQQKQTYQEKAGKVVKESRVV